MAPTSGNWASPQPQRLSHLQDPETQPCLVSPPCKVSCRYEWPLQIPVQGVPDGTVTDSGNRCRFRGGWRGELSVGGPGAACCLTLGSVNGQMYYSGSLSFDTELPGSSPFAGGLRLMQACQWQKMVGLERHPSVEQERKCHSAMDWLVSNPQPGCHHPSFRDLKPSPRTASPRPPRRTPRVRFAGRRRPVPTCHASPAPPLCTGPGHCPALSSPAG